MIPGFNRSITFPMTQRPKRAAVYHVRSFSLPGGSHPVIANLEEKIRAVQSWAAGADASLAAIEAGLSHIELLISAVIEFLNISETKKSLQHAAASTEFLLESFLYLVDSYGSLQSELMALKQHHFEVQSALRRHDYALIASSLKSQRRIEKELNHIAAATRGATTKFSHLGLPSDASEAQIVEILKEAIGATSAASVVLLNRVVAVSAAASTAAAMLAPFTVRPFKTRSCNGQREMSIHVKFEELEGCIEMVERGTEMVLRRLVNSRVLLLNIQSGLF